MLTLHRAQRARPPERKPKFGLAIAGGGPVGAIYELGALRALDEAIEGVRLHELDVYVGISAGSFIVSSLANGISAGDICRTFVDHPGAEFRLRPDHFYRPDYRGYLQSAKKVPFAFTNSLLKIIRDPLHASVSSMFDTIGRCLPSGLFDSSAIEEYLKTVFESGGRTNDFTRLQCKLYVVAVDLDNGEAVRFGDANNNQVPISRAVQASAALPALYSPVKIDGHYYVDGALRRTLHASAALDEGVDILFGINPLVPFASETEPEPGSVPVSRLIQGGLPVILSQTFRALIQSRMKVGFTKYRDSHPGSNLILLEPNRGDEAMFFTNVFSFSSRNALCDHAYRVTRKGLLAEADALDEILKPHGMRIDRAVLQDQERSLKDSLDEGVYGRSPVLRKLARALDDLQFQIKKRAS